jgi:hypothetical protein
LEVEIFQAQRPANGMSSRASANIQMGFSGNDTAVLKRLYSLLTRPLFVHYGDFHHNDMGGFGAVSVQKEDI